MPNWAFNADVNAAHCRRLTLALACTLITGIMKIVIETNVAASIRDVWQAFNNPDNIVQWDATND